MGWDGMMWIRFDRAEERHFVSPFAPFAPPNCYCTSRMTRLRSVRLSAPTSADRQAGTRAECGLLRMLAVPLGNMHRHVFYTRGGLELWRPREEKRPVPKSLPTHPPHLAS